MRGKKAKAIRRMCAEMVAPEALTESTQYEVISHPLKRRANIHTGIMETFNPRQLVVKSAFRRMVLDVKHEYKLLLSSGIIANVHQF